MTESSEEVPRTISSVFDDSFPTENVLNARTVNIYSVSENVFPNNAVIVPQVYGPIQTSFTNGLAQCVPVRIQTSSELEGNIEQYSEKLSSLHLSEETTAGNNQAPLRSCRVCHLMVVYFQHMAHEVNCYTHHLNRKKGLLLEPSLKSAENHHRYPVTGINYSTLPIENAVCVTNCTSYGFKDKPNVQSPLLARNYDTCPDPMAYEPNMWNNLILDTDLMPPSDEEPLAQQITPNIIAENVYSGNFDTLFQDSGASPVFDESYTMENTVPLHFISFLDNCSTSSADSMVDKESSFDLNATVPFTTTETVKYVQNGHQVDMNTFTPTSLNGHENILNYGATNLFVNEYSLFTNAFQMTPGSNTDRTHLHSANYSRRKSKSKNLDQSQIFLDKTESYNGFTPVDKVRDWASLTFGNHTIMEDLRYTRLTKKDKTDEVTTSSDLLTRSQANPDLALNDFPTLNETQSARSTKFIYVESASNDIQFGFPQEVGETENNVGGLNDQNFTSLTTRYNGRNYLPPTTRHNGRNCSPPITRYNGRNYSPPTIKYNDRNDFPPTRRNGRNYSPPTTRHNDRKYWAMYTRHNDRNCSPQTMDHNDENYSPPAVQNGRAYSQPTARHNGGHYVAPTTRYSDRKFLPPTGWRNSQKYSAPRHMGKNYLPQSYCGGTPEKYPHELEYWEQQSPRYRKFTLKDVIDANIASPVSKTRNRRRKTKEPFIKPEENTSSVTEIASTENQTKGDSDLK